MTTQRAPEGRTHTVRLELVQPTATSVTPFVTTHAYSGPGPWTVLGWIAVGIVGLIVFFALLGAIGKSFSGAGTTIPYIQSDTIGTAPCRLSDGRKGRIGYRNGQARCYATGS